KVYDEIVNLVRQRSPKREEFIQGVISAIEEDLKENKVKGKVAGRPKQYYSIYQKMVVRGREFDDIYDLVGIRVIVPDVRDCYAILGAIHARWNPVPGRFKDYIAMPKFNLYQSLHTTVIGPSGRPVEIQIRTQEMHNRAEYGVAAHWKYKEGNTTRLSSEEDLVWLKHLADWQGFADSGCLGALCGLEFHDVSRCCAAGAAGDDHHAVCQPRPGCGDARRPRLEYFFGWLARHDDCGICGSDGGPAQHGRAHPVAVVAGL
ncbi:MAG: bifunctional (p)ppGpp synthetase/guanosine-3',5'-bis(diphosphate) 3'-pyrophosphohydrolase, partial [Betaproteobacteria bacterium]|nr:bifunctional (p)ppGpp synthetase/guanosine-3',5'-bis(diphosphate) 3'-pyrophosphohydrolase [Betaproteobacteria bacterium]